MTLHQTTEIFKKWGIYIAAVIAGIVLVIGLFRFGFFVKNIIAPSKADPPTVTYDKLPPIPFPEDATQLNLTYQENTVEGSLPTNFPDRMVVYPIIQEMGGLLSLDSAREKVAAIGYRSSINQDAPEKKLEDEKYEWVNERGMGEKITFNIVTFDFSVTSSYLTNLTVRGARSLSDQTNAIGIARDFVSDLGLLSEDIDLSKTQNPAPSVRYFTYPRLFTISGAGLVPTTSLSTAQIIRVDFYQKDIEHEMNTGDKNSPTLKQSLPILYPNPPYSTMNFLIGSSGNGADVLSANFTYKMIDFSAQEQATYPIKTAKEAYEELQSGGGYIASYTGVQEEVLIDKVYLGYYLGEEDQEYLMPIIVFEGSDNFFGYVSAVRDDQIQ